MGTMQQFPQLEELKERLKQRANDLQFQLEEIQDQLDAVNTTLDLLSEAKSPQNPQEIVRPLPTPHIGVSPSDLKGLTQIDALVKIAKANNNQVRLVTARDLIVEAGLTHSKKNAMNIIFNVIKRSDKFRKASPGIYELVPGGTVDSITPQSASLEF